MLNTNGTTKKHRQLLALLAFSFLVSTPLALAQDTDFGQTAQDLEHSMELPGDTLMEPIPVVTPEPPTIEAEISPVALEEPAEISEAPPSTLEEPVPVAEPLPVEPSKADMADLEEALSVVEEELKAIEENLATEAVQPIEDIATEIQPAEAVIDVADEMPNVSDEPSKMEDAIAKTLEQSDDAVSSVSEDVPEAMFPELSSEDIESLINPPELPADPPSARMIDEPLPENLEDFESFDSMLRTLERADPVEADNLFEQPGSNLLSSDMEVVEDFEDFIRLIAKDELAANAGSLDSLSPAVTEENLARQRVREDELIRALNEADRAIDGETVQEDIAKDTLAKAVKAEDDASDSFLGGLFGGGFVSHAEVERGLDTAKTEEQAQASAMSSKVFTHSSHDFEDVSAEMATIMGEPKKLFKDDSSMALASPSQKKTLRQNAARNAEYQELVESLTTKIKLLEREKQSLRGALKGQKRVILP